MRALTMVAIAASLALAACSSTGSGEPPVAAAVAPAAPVVSGVLAGAFGASLPEADRQHAFSAQLAALDTGKRQSWRGGNGLFGYVEPGADSMLSAGKCREYAHTIYVAGRPKSASGSACKQPDGSWRASS